MVYEQTKNDCKADPHGYNILAAEQSRTDVKLENQVLIKTRTTTLFMLGSDAVDVGKVEKVLLWRVFLTSIQSIGKI